MILSWVIGAHGLLGSALSRLLAESGTSLFDVGQRLEWDDTARLRTQLTGAVMRFGAEATGADGWEIYWAAGVGTMRSAIADLEPERIALETLLQALSGCAFLRGKPGAFALASSAGAIYAGSAACPVSESTAIAPTTAYASSKLAQEALLAAFAASQPAAAVLLARLTTLYGAGQSTAKQQGLLTHIANAVLRNAPIHIYVPLDTVRDYLAAQDAAIALVATLRSEWMHAGQARIRIVASQRPTTISEILSIFRIVARRAPRVVTSRSAASSIYAPQLTFRSEAPGAGQHSTSLVIGIAQVLNAARTRYARAGENGRH